MQDSLNFRANPREDANSVSPQNARKNQTNIMYSNDYGIIYIYTFEEKMFVE